MSGAIIATVWLSSPQREISFPLRRVAQPQSGVIARQEARNATRASAQAVVRACWRMSTMRARTSKAQAHELMPTLEPCEHSRDWRTRGEDTTPWTAQLWILAQFLFLIFFLCVSCFSPPSSSSHMSPSPSLKLPRPWLNLFHPFAHHHTCLTSPTFILFFEFHWAAKEGAFLLMCSSSLRIVFYFRLS